MYSPKPGKKRSAARSALAGCIDYQIVKAIQVGGQQHGYDAGKYMKAGGSEPTQAVHPQGQDGDTFVVKVTVANVSEKAVAQSLLTKVMAHQEEPDEVV